MEDEVFKILETSRLQIAISNNMHDISHTANGQVTNEYPFEGRCIDHQRLMASHLPKTKCQGLSFCKVNIKHTHYMMLS